MSLSQRLSGPFASLLIAAALVLRVAMPAGWMPVTTAQGVELAPCAGMGPMQMAAMDHAGHAKSPATPAQTSPCGFDALAEVTAPVAAMVLPPPPVAYTRISEPRRVAFTRTGVGEPPRPATGPPTSA